MTVVRPLTHVETHMDSELPTRSEILDSWSRGRRSNVGLNLIGSKISITVDGKVVGQPYASISEIIHQVILNPRQQIVPGALLGQLQQELHALSGDSMRE